MPTQHPFLPSSLARKPQFCSAVPSHGLRGWIMPGLNQALQYCLLYQWLILIWVWNSVLAKGTQGDIWRTSGKDFLINKKKHKGENALPLQEMLSCLCVLPGTATATEKLWGRKALICRGRRRWQACGLWWHPLDTELPAMERLYLLTPCYVR